MSPYYHRYLKFQTILSKIMFGSGLIVVYNQLVESFGVARRPLTRWLRAAWSTGCRPLPGVCGGGMRSNR